jgi:DNA mismatch repair ATPase MutS
MKAFLLFRDRDVDLQQKLPPQAQALIQDLELPTLFDAMAQGDTFLLEVIPKVVLSSVEDLDTIRYRQQILQDCLKHVAIVREIYALAVEAIASERRVFYGFFGKYPGTILHRATEVIHMFVNKLKKLRAIADNHAGTFESEGFTTLFAVLQRELSEDYFTRVQDHLKELAFRQGVLISAELGRGNKGINYTLRRHSKKQSWIERTFTERRSAFTITIAERDESGAKALSDLRDRGINLVANALAQSTDHILSFFTMLRTELAFYLGCVNLYEQLIQRGKPVCFPVAAALGERRQAFQGLYDASLVLTMMQPVVGNDVNADEKDLVIITGANQGGKSTFLRSIGLAQVMMQCGMFVPAESFCANVCTGLFTHYKRKEDAAMESGKLAEELSRMSTIVDTIRPDALLLFNESFAVTNEREGSEIARQIVCALLEKRIKVFFVTHLYEFARSFSAAHMTNTLFLRSERQADGRRTFKLIEGEPQETSYGEDVYHTVFGTAVQGQVPAKEMS